MEHEYAISPSYTTKSFGWPMTLDDKILIFIDRVSGWQLDIAGQILEGRQDKNGNMVATAIQHSDYAALHIMTSYFETIAKYKAGYCQSNKSAMYFKEGVTDVFPELKTIPIATNALTMLYEQLRCGLYHISMTGQDIVLTRQIDAALRILGNSKMIIQIHPIRLLNCLKVHLVEYSIQLLDIKDAKLRENFERRFKCDNDIKP